MSAALRMEQHLLARTLMGNGDYLAAIEALSETYAKYGSHILLLGDLIACYFLLGRHAECAYFITKYQQELLQAKPLLNPQTSVKALIFLGKLLEEQGDVAAAVEAYEQGINLSTEFSETILLGRTQILRIQATYKMKKNLELVYQYCLQAKASSKNLFFEIEHALIMAELHIFDLETALIRAKELFMSPEILEADRRLVFFDLLEASLQLQIKIPQALVDLSAVLRADEFDSFEMTLWKLAWENSFQLNYAELNKLAQTVTPMSLIRLHRLALLQEITGQEKKQINQRFLFLLKTVSHKSFLLLSKEWRQEISAEDQIFVVHAEQGRIALEKNEITVKPQSQLLKILSFFSSSKTHALEDFVREIFEQDLNESSHERSRKAISRCNTELSFLTGEHKAFTVTKTEIALRSDLKIVVE